LGAVRRCLHNQGVAVAVRSARADLLAFCVETDTASGASVAVRSVKFSCTGFARRTRPGVTAGAYTLRALVVGSNSSCMGRAVQVGVAAGAFGVDNVPVIALVAVNTTKPGRAFATGSTRPLRSALAYARRVIHVRGDPHGTPAAVGGHIALTALGVPDVTLRTVVAETACEV
jgi:hypothetical protein